MTENLMPKEKAAILMVALGKDFSSKIYKHLTDDEIEQLTLSITGLRAFDKETRDEVISEFYDLCVTQKYICLLYTSRKSKRGNRVSMETN